MPGSFEHWSIVITRPVRRVAQAAVVTTLVAGAVGVSYFDKSVNLSVDGKASAVHAFGSTVGDVLAKQDIKVGEHDVVVPSAGSKIEDGQKIVVRYGRKLSVTVDGKTRDYWTTATTVAAALQELGIRADSAKLSASRSQTLGREGLALSVTTPKALTVHVDGKNLTGSSTSPTVKDALGELKVKVDRDDRVKPALNAPLTSGMQIAIQRVTAKTVKRHPGHLVLHRQEVGLLDLQGRVQDGHHRQGRRQGRDLPDRDRRRQDREQEGRSPPSSPRSRSPRSSRSAPRAVRPPPPPPPRPRSAATSPRLTA